MTRLRVGTRGSQLALWQARTVAERLDGVGVTCEIIVIRTSGDQLQQAPLSEIGGKRLFVKEIEDALLRADVDLAVHSAKDMPADLPDALAISAVLPREDPRDALVLPKRPDPPMSAWPDAANPYGLSTLGHPARVGTGSVRRVAQIRRLLEAAEFHPIRGNLDTRLRKLDEGSYDALVLACAGMKRLGFGARISSPLAIADCVPAPGQGIVAIEIRADDETTRQATRAINDASTMDALEAERALVTALGGGCQLPLGGVALDAHGDLEMHAIVTSLDGARIVRRQARDSRSNAAALGRRLAMELIEGGAAEILAEARGTQAPVEGSS